MQIEIILANAACILGCRAASRQRPMITDPPFLKAATTSTMTSRISLPPMPAVIAVIAANAIIVLVDGV
jgi:hypothetical protein